VKTVLETLFHELNQQHFAGELPLPNLRWNSRLSSSAGRFCPGSRNPLRPRKPEIEVATYLKALPDGEIHIRDTILHEMVHYVLWHRQRPYGHTPEFRRILKSVGARRYNPVPKTRPYKHWYQCLGCKKLVPARRKIAQSACSACCKKYSGGKYSERFRLVPAAAPGENAPSFVAPTPPEPPRMAPADIVRKLEELKRMILRT